MAQRRAYALQKADRTFREGYVRVQDCTARSSQNPCLPFAPEHQTPASSKRKCLGQTEGARRSLVLIHPIETVKHSLNSLNDSKGNGSLFCLLSPGLQILIYLRPRQRSGWLSIWTDAHIRQEVGWMIQQVPLYSENWSCDG